MKVLSIFLEELEKTGNKKEAAHKVLYINWKAFYHFINLLTRYLSLNLGKRKFKLLNGFLELKVNDQFRTSFLKVSF